MVERLDERAESGFTPDVAPVVPDEDDPGHSQRVLRLTGKPASPASWVMDLVRHRETLGILTRKDFQTRYKRASFGVVWAIAVPALQATIMAIVFSKVVRVGAGAHFPVYVISGVVAYSYFQAALTTASTAIVDNATLSDKVWFPRAVLVIVPCLSNLVGLFATLIVVVIVIPLFGVHYGLHLLWVIPGSVLLILFVCSLALVLAALHVYFRDVRFLVQAALMVWMYATPILYPPALLGHTLGRIVSVNPLTGIIEMFHLAALGTDGPSDTALAISLGATAALLLIATEFHRRCDRLFVDKM